MTIRPLFGLLLLVASLLQGCGMTITPPAGVTDPVNIFITDHGIHTSIMLPRESGELAQFSYSRYDWAALDLDQWYRSLPALLVPGPGTIGTRDYPGPDTLDNAAHQIVLANNHPPVQAIFAVPVSMAACQRVVSAIDARWHEHESTVVANSRRGLRFVKDSTSYSVFHNCNHEVAQWLRDLGCRVDGMGMTADVQVRAAPGSDAPPAVVHPAPNLEATRQ